MNLEILSEAQSALREIFTDQALFKLGDLCREQNFQHLKVEKIKFEFGDPSYGDEGQTYENLGDIEINGDSAQNFFCRILDEEYSEDEQNPELQQETLVFLAILRKVFGPETSCSYEALIQEWLDDDTRYWEDIIWEDLIESASVDGELLGCEIEDPFNYCIDNHLHEAHKTLKMAIQEIEKGINELKNP